MTESQPKHQACADFLFYLISDRESFEVIFLDGKV